MCLFKTYDCSQKAAKIVIFGPYITYKSNDFASLRNLFINADLKCFHSSLISDNVRWFPVLRESCSQQRDQYFCIVMCTIYSFRKLMRDILRFSLSPRTSIYTIHYTPHFPKLQIYSLSMLAQLKLVDRPRQSMISSQSIWKHIVYVLNN